MKYSLAIALLLSSQSASAVSINSITSLNLQQKTQVVEKINESTNSQLGRFINSIGQAIDPMEAGYHKIELTQQKSLKAPQDESLIQSEACFLTKDAKLEGKGCKPAKSGDASMIHMPSKYLSSNLFVGELFIGNPPQKVRAVFDTGSTNTWIINKKIADQVKNKLYYEGEASKTSKKLKQEASISFGSGSLQGHFYQDDIMIGSCSSDNKKPILLKNQMFGSIEKQKTIFGKTFEGIVGLGYPALAEKGVKPVFDGMMDQKLLKSNMFAFSIAKGVSGSDLTLGYYDKQKFTGEIAWNKVLYKYMYGVKLDDMKVNGKSTGVCKNKECLITFDSGAEGLLTYPEYAVEIFAKQGIPTLDSMIKCSSNQDFGDLTLVIGGKDYTFTTNEWMNREQTTIGLSQLEQLNTQAIGPIGPELESREGSELILNHQTEIQLAQSFEELRGNGNKVCKSKIKKLQISQDQFLVGLEFMKKFYTIFDRDNDRVGLATAS